MRQQKDIITGVEYIDSIEILASSPYPPRFERKRGKQFSPHSFSPFTHTANSFSLLSHATTRRIIRTIIIIIFISIMPLEKSTHVEELQQQQQQQQQVTENNNDSTIDKNVISWERWMESLVRITFAGSGGSIVGLALQKQNLNTTFTKSTPTTTTTTGSRTVVLQQQQQQLVHKHLPMTWAISCMMFTLFVESSRILSPTSLLCFHYFSNHTGGISSWNEYYPYTKTITTTIGDSMVGGMLGGLIGTLGIHRHSYHRQQPPSPQQQKRHATIRLSPRILVWGMGVGTILGGCLGIIQAGIDLGNDYLKEQQLEQQQEEEVR